MSHYANLVTNIVDQEALVRALCRVKLPQFADHKQWIRNHIKTYDKVLETNITVPGLTNTNLQQLSQIRESGPQEQNAGPPGSGMNQNNFFFQGNTNGASTSDFTTGAKKP